MRLRLAVLSHSHLEKTILATRDGTRILAVPVDAFDSLIDRDPVSFTRRGLELESQRMQQLMRSA